MSETAERLWEILTDRPTPRYYLRDALGVSDRALRRAVTELRKNGYNVAANSSTGGYWKGDDNDKKHTIAEYRSRAYELLATASAMECGPLDGQEAIL